MYSSASGGLGFGAAVLAAVSGFGGGESAGSTQDTVPSSAADEASQGPEAGSFRSDFRNRDDLMSWTRLRVDGFAEPWRVFEIRRGSLVIEPTSSGWFEDMVGGHLYREFTGNFILTTRVRVRGVDSGTPQTAFSLAGLFVRAPRDGLTASSWVPGRENWMFLSVGTASPAGTRQFEIKSTTDSVSSLRFAPAPEGWVELRIARHGELFTLVQRAEGERAWSVLQQFIRPDLPETLQIGVTAYADWDSVAPVYPDFTRINTEGAPTDNADLRAEFDWIRIEPAIVPRVPIFALEVPPGAFAEDLIRARTAEILGD